MLYRRIIPYLVLLAMLAGCNAPADPQAMQHPIHQRIVNAELVTLEFISVNGEKIPETSRNLAIDTFRKYVAGDVRVVEGKPATVKPDKDGKITYKQIDEILNGRQHHGASDIAILYLPEIAKNKKYGAMYCYNSNGKEFRQYILYQSSFITKRVKEKKHPLSEETCHHLVLLHELCHSFWVPCDKKRSWSERHCTHSDCIIYPGVDFRSYGTFLLRGKPPTDLCPLCQAEIRQAQQAAKGERIPPDRPYDFLTYYDGLVRLNPDNPRAYRWRFRYHYGCKRYDLAVADLTRLTELEPDNLQNYMNRAVICQAKGDTPAAEKDIHEIAKRLGTNADDLNQFAWLLATAPLKEWRNGNIAIQVATKACTLDDWKSAHYIDTLAAAYAEKGLFDKAVEFGTQAVTMNQDKNDQEKFQKRLELYKQKKPFRAPLPRP